MRTLPVDGHVDSIRRLLAEHRRVVVTAPPGSGKSTRIPPVLAADGRLVLLQPRRVAARSIARRIASERGWRIGVEVGWHIRFERRYTRETGLVVATEGVLVRQLLADPLLSDTCTVVIDEFHERSIHADLSIAFVKQAMAAREGLRLVVMSATLDTQRVAAYLDDAPIVEIEGSLYPVETRWRPGDSMDRAVVETLKRPGHDVLCFLPGAREIRDAKKRIAADRPDVAVHELHGSMDVDAQEAALQPSDQRKVILATNIAETSLTVEGVDTVIDGGLHRVLRYDSTIGIDRLQTERIPRDSAEQRAGRAGRLGPGVAIRLWDARDELREHREAEIARVDLAGVILDVLAWGDDPLSFDWFESPEKARIEKDLQLLASLGAVSGRRLTSVGRSLQRLPVHPRLARILLAASDRKTAARVCAIVSEGDRWASGTMERDGLGADVGLLVDRFDEAPQAVRRLALELESVVGEVGSTGGNDSVERAILRGFPDRVAKRRSDSRERVLLTNGVGGVLAGGGVSPDSDWIVALDVTASDRSHGRESLVRLASPIDVSWLTPSQRSIDTELDGNRIRAWETTHYGSIEMARLQVEPDSSEAERLLFEELKDRGLGKDDIRLQRRMRFAGVDCEVEALMRQACAGRVELPAFRLVDWIRHDTRSRLEAFAPERIEVPSGRSIALDYREDGDVMLSVKLQELFGLAESPRIGPNHTAVAIELLAPNGRPVQITTDLRSFWETTYQEVRKELRGRYPKHPWPEDPWTAKATGRTSRRDRSRK